MMNLLLNEICVCEECGKAFKEPIVSYEVDEMYGREEIIEYDCCPFCEGRAIVIFQKEDLNSDGED